MILGFTAGHPQFPLSVPIVQACKRWALGALPKDGASSAILKFSNWKKHTPLLLLNSFINLVSKEPSCYIQSTLKQVLTCTPERDWSSYGTNATQFPHLVSFILFGHLTCQIQCISDNCLNPSEISAQVEVVTAFSAISNLFSCS